MATNLSRHIVILDSYTTDFDGAVDWSGLNKLGKVTKYPRTKREEVNERVENADVILTNKCIIDAAVMEAATNLKYIGVLASGINCVDLQAAKERQIGVTNVKNYSSGSVAQQVFYYILEHCISGYAYAKSVKEGDWDKSPDFCYNFHTIRQVESKNLLIIGYGNIGQRLEKVATAFGMNVTVAQLPDRPEVPGRVPLDKGLAMADFVSLHCPLAANTQHLVNDDFLSKMKPNSALINTGRGGLVDEIALIKALDEGRLATAYLDVIDTEPPQSATTKALVRHPKTFVTPHIAWTAVECRKKLVEEVTTNLSEFLRGGMRNRVDV